jgi:flagellar export protein FliJ
MAAFKFKFKTVQNVKKNLEKKAQKELAVIDGQIKKLEEINAELESELKNHRLSTDNNTKVSEVQFLKGYGIYIEAKIYNNINLIDELHLQKKKKIKELVQKSKEHTMFDIMEEKHLDRFNKDQNKADLKNIDEIAIQKFARVKK